MISRFYWVLLRNLHHLYMIPQMEYMARHPEKYSEQKRYATNVLCVKRVCKPGRIKTIGYGMENLPKNGGYILCPNHQGKFDALGIMLTHEKPCSIVMDIEKSYVPLTKQFIDMVQGKRLDTKDVRQSIKIIKEMAEEAKQGKKFIIFPEGGYCHNGNDTTFFKPGAFKSAVWAKCPIVPVALINSYMCFEYHNLKPVTTYVFYLEPIYYDDYKNLTTVEIAQMVQNRIQSVLDEYKSGTLKLPK